MNEISVHTMPLEVLRARGEEARRLIAQARKIARVSLDADAETLAPSSNDSADPSRRVGLLLDAAQRLLPGMPSLAEERVPYSRASKRPPESSWRRVTLRGGAERALESIERAQILEDIADDAAGLIAEIERRTSATFRAAGPVDLSFPPLPLRERGRG